MNKLFTSLLLLIATNVALGQNITPGSFMDDFTSALGSQVTYSTLYTNYYVTLERDLTNERYKLVVEPKINEWRPVVIGFDNANGGNGIDISGHPIMKIRIRIPTTAEVPGNSDLKLAFYISDGITLGEYDEITGEDYLVSGLKPGTDTTLTFDWTNAKQVTNWGVWPPATGSAPDLTRIKSIGLSINTNSTANGTYYIKRIEFGNATDCNGINGGNAYEDGCDDCVGGNTGTTSQCQKDCSGEYGGTAAVDACGNCAGGTTAITSVSDPNDCVSTSIKVKNNKTNLKIFPVPASKIVTLSEQVDNLIILDVNGVLVYKDTTTDIINISQLKPGVYLVKTDKGKTTLVIEK